MSAIIQAPNTGDLLRAIDDLKQLPTQQFYEPAVTLGQSLLAHGSAANAGLGEIAGEIDRRYATAAIDRYAKDVGMSGGSLYDYWRWVRMAGGKENAIALIAAGYNYERQRNAMRHCPDTETFIARLTGQALPDPSTPKRPRKIVDAQRAIVCEIRGQFAIIDLGALAVDVELGECRIAIWKREE